MGKMSLVSLAVLFLISASCAGPVENNPLDRYWDESYSGELGFHASGVDQRLLTLAGKPLYISGVNCYNLFLQCFEKDSMRTTEMEETVKVLARQEVPVVRFSCGPYYATQMNWYTDYRNEYMADLERLASLCDENHILLIPSFFWNSACVPAFKGEELAAWGDKTSGTYSFMVSYTEDIVNALKDHKCVAAWEFGNEFNLQADIESEGFPPLPAAAVGTAAQGFGETVRAHDPHGRLVLSGYSVMRNSQWNLEKKNGWVLDTFDQYVEITGVMTPDSVDGMSEHIYEEKRAFEGIGELDRESQLAKAKEAAARLGKVYYVGEFTGPKTAMGDTTLLKSHFSAYHNQGIQLSLIWNYALRGDVEWSFKEGDYDDIAFRLIREFNNQFTEE